jgi:hypothetical protein
MSNQQQTNEFTAEELAKGDALARELKNVLQAFILVLY